MAVAILVYRLDMDNEAFHDDTENEIIVLFLGWKRSGKSSIKEVNNYNYGFQKIIILDKLSTIKNDNNNCGYPFGYKNRKNDYTCSAFLMGCNKFKCIPILRIT